MHQFWRVTTSSEMVLNSLLCKLMILFLFYFLKEIVEFWLNFNLTLGRKVGLFSAKTKIVIFSWSALFLKSELYFVNTTRFYKIWNADFKIGVGTFYHNLFLSQIDSNEPRSHFLKKEPLYFWKYQMFFKWGTLFVYGPYGTHMGPIWGVSKSYNEIPQVYGHIKNVSSCSIHVDTILLIHFINLV